MIEFLIDIRQHIIYVILGLFGILFISFFLFFKSKQIVKVLIGIGTLFLIAIFTMLLNVAIKDLLRSEIKDMAELALNTESRILINGKDLNIDSDQLLIDLAKIDGFYFTNKSERQTAFLVRILTKNDTLDVKLMRDSKRPEKYWTFLPKYDFELELDLIETHVFNGINE
ncbi:MAG: hypothetical protein JXR11_06140 [Balneola sp.]